jgi:hypothetical protein
MGSAVTGSVVEYLLDVADELMPGVAAGVSFSGSPEMLADAPTGF